MNALVHLVRARDRSRQAQDEFHAAITRARAEGFTFEEIGKALGVTKQTVSQSLKRRAA